MSEDEVRFWLIIEGIGHALQRHDSGSPLCYWTACGTVINRGTKTDLKPKRICRRCRTELFLCEPGKDS